MSHLQNFTRRQLHLGSLPDAPEHLTQPLSWAPPPGPDTSQHKYLSWFPNSKRCGVAELLAWPALLSQCPTFQTASLTDCIARQPPLSFRSSSAGTSLLPVPRSVPARLETLGVCQDCDRSRGGELVQAHGAPCSQRSPALLGSLAAGRGQGWLLRLAGQSSSVPESWRLQPRSSWTPTRRVVRGSPWVLETAGAAWKVAGALAPGAWGAEPGALVLPKRGTARPASTGGLKNIVCFSGHSC